jgi:hypothetical protein
MVSPRNREIRPSIEAFAQSLLDWYILELTDGMVACIRGQTLYDSMEASLVWWKVLRGLSALESGQHWA